LRQHKRLSERPRTWRYVWDANDRLVAVTTPDGQRWRYRYDPLGRRIAKGRLGDDGVSVVEQVHFTWDGTVLAEQTRSGGEGGSARTTVWEWEPGSFRPISQTERAPARDASQRWIDEQFYAIVTDLVGTPTELVDADGNLAWRPRTTLWGTHLGPEPGGASCPLRFPGQYHDPETGLNYNYFRYYDPDAGRYESNDPLGLEGGLNSHAYVCNPTNWLDPLGLMGCEKPIRRIYEHNPKHGTKSRIDSRGREVSRAPRGYGQSILDNSVPKGPNSPHRIGTEPETDLPVELRQHLRQEFENEIVERYHGYVPEG
ncbi:MAG: RHS repeat-associated core domain-containing protein, partial [Actinomycetota bacterium]